MVNITLNKHICSNIIIMYMYKITHTLLINHLYIDECIDGTHDCSQTCINNEGSFTCGCNNGYLQDGAVCTNI